MTAATDLVTSGPATPESWISGTWTIDPAHTTVSRNERRPICVRRFTWVDAPQCDVRLAASSDRAQA